MNLPGLDAWKTNADDAPDPGRGSHDERPMHTHICPDCDQRFDCDGEEERNHDGHPLVICRWFHLPDGTVTPCRACEERRANADARRI